MNWGERFLLVALAGGGVVAALLRSDLWSVDGFFGGLSLMATVGAVLLLWGAICNHGWIYDHTWRMRTLARLLGSARMRYVYGVLGVVLLLMSLIAARYFNGL